MDVAAAVRAITPDEGWISPIEQACSRFDINTENRIAPFLANCAHESQGFKSLRESMHYSAARLCEVFPKYFTAADAVDFSCDDERIAERVYGGRMGNGPEGSGDGYAYRGGGLIQITGRGMYRKCGQAIGADLESDPDWITQPFYAALSAAWLWADEKHCNEIADDGRFLSIVLRVNGGTNGMDDRLQWLEKIRESFHKQST